MKVKTILLVLLLLIGIICNAQQQVTRQEAINAAVNTMKYNNKDVDEFMVDTVFTRINKGRVLLYEIHFTTGESVLLSGNRSCIPILGLISNNGGFYQQGVLHTNNEIPDGLKYLLDFYSDQVDLCFDNNVKGYYADEWDALQNYHQYDKDGINTEQIRRVELPLNTQWGQSMSNDLQDCDYHAYNYYVEATSNSCGTGDAAYCPAGCIPVAMGQIMKYWNYPPQVPRWFWEFDFDTMPSELIKSSSNYGDKRKAVASLLQKLGTCIGIQYCNHGNCESGITMENIQMVETAFHEFGYLDATLVSKNHYTDEDWKQLIINEIDNERPVYYSGIDTTHHAGHAFVIYGYRKPLFSNCLFYVNWGFWGLFQDSQFALGNLTPSPNINNYSYNEADNIAVINVYPSNCWNNIYFIRDKEFNYPDLKYYQASNTISTNNRVFDVKSGACVELHARNVILTNGFRANYGSTFKATVDPCTANSDRSSDKRMRNIDFGFLHNNNVREYDNDDRLMLYPNPTMDKLNIILNPNMGSITSITVFDMMGNVVSSMINLDDNSLDVSNLPVGLFLVQVVFDNGDVAFRKLIKQ